MRLLERDLIAIVGTSGLVPVDETADRYLFSYRGGSGAAQAIVRPRSVEDVQSVVRYCYKNDISLIAQGANTGLVGASTPDRSGDQILICFDRLDDILAYSPLDRTATVQSGVRLSALNARAGTDDLCCPIDLGSDPSLGGMAATNAGGARLIRYGDMRCQILGLEYVLIDENASICGNLSTLRKNNTGPSIDQCLIGSGGELALITAVAVQLQPCQRLSTSVIIELASEDDVPNIISALEHALGPSLLACEGMSRGAMMCAMAYAEPLNLPFSAEAPPVYALLVEASHDNGNGLAENLWERLGSALEPFFETSIANASLGDGSAFWALRHRISDALKHEGQVIGHDIAINRSDLPQFHRVMRERLSSRWQFLKIRDFGHVADGGDHYNLIWPYGSEPGVDRERIVQEIRDTIYRVVVGEFGGTFSAEHGLGPLNASAFRQFIPPTKRRIIAELKRCFDPKGLLGHGVIDFETAEV